MILIFIYKITNKVNKKIYIGQTINSIEKRFQRHINDALNYVVDTHLARAIRKYGKDQFEIELIECVSNQIELTTRERYWINFYNSTNSKIGYNETDAEYKCGGNTYKNKSNDEMNCIKEKIRNSKVGSKNPNSKQVKCLNINTGKELIFDSFEECKKFFNENTHRFITTRVKHQTSSLYKEEWNISYVDDEYMERPRKTNKSGTYVKVVNLNTSEEYYYESIRLASRETKVSRNKINTYIKTKTETFIINEFEFTVLN